MNNQTIIPVKMYGPVYKLIYKYEFLLPIIATSGIGVVNLGTIGLISGALGAVDIVANDYKIYDKPYLTYAALGWGSLSSFKTPYYISDIIGVAAGLLFPTGILYPHLDKIIAPISGAISGYSYMGPYGAGIGFSVGLVDEGLSLYNITHEYPLTSTLKNVATANLFLPQANRVVNYILPEGLGFIKSTCLEVTKLISKTGVKETIAVAISGMTLFSEEKSEKVKSPALQLSEDLNDLYAEIIPKNQLDDLIEKQFISLIATQIMLAKLGLTFTKYNQNIGESFTNLVQTDESWMKFIGSLSVICKYLVPYIGSDIVSSYINGYFINKITNIMSDKLNDELLTGEISLHLKQERNQNSVIKSKEVIYSKVLVEKMEGDIASIAGNNLLPDAISKVISGGYSIGHLYSIRALDTILYSSFYNQLTSKITHGISEQYYSYTTRLNDLGTKIHSKYEHVKVNADSMVAYNANEFNKMGREELVDQLRELQAEQNLWQIAISTWSTFKGITNFLFNWLIIANQVYSGDLDRNNRNEVISMTQDFSSMVSWDASNAGPVMQLRQSMDRIIELKARMDEVENKLDRKPSYHYQKGEQTGICLNDFKVGKGEESRLYIKDLCIFDKHVAVTSTSGAGKSTFFKAIKQIMHDGVWSEGSITYITKEGNYPYIAMTSQNDYITPEDTLLELITFKKGHAVEPYRDRAIELLKEIKIDSVKEGEISLIDSLDIKKDWVTGTSGGQKQKMDAVRLMLSPEKPDIIIFDEIFAGLDHNSIHTLQEMLDNEFPDTQIFVIDHELKSHNTEGWYHNELHLSNDTAQLLGSPAE